MLSTGSIRYFSKKINLFVNTCMCVLMPYFHKIATKTRRTTRLPERWKPRAPTSTTPPAQEQNAGARLTTSSRPDDVCGRWCDAEEDGMRHRRGRAHRLSPCEDAAAEGIHRQDDSQKVWLDPWSLSIRMTVCCDVNVMNSELTGTLFVLDLRWHGVSAQVSTEVVCLSVLASRGLKSMFTFLSSELSIVFLLLVKYLFWSMVHIYD